MHLIATFVDECQRTIIDNNTMKVSAKFILAFLLLMLSFSISGIAGNSSSCISACASSCQFSESTSGCSKDSSVDDNSVGYDNAHSLSISDAELGFKPITESNANTYRLHRIIEINDSLNVIHKFFLLRENSLVLDQSKSYYSDKDPHYSIICSDYYVFALRRILI